MSLDCVIMKVSYLQHRLRNSYLQRPLIRVMPFSSRNVCILLHGDYDKVGYLAVPIIHIREWGGYQNICPMVLLYIYVSLLSLPSSYSLISSKWQRWMESKFSTKALGTVS